MTDVLGKQFNAGDPGFGMHKLTEKGPNTVTVIKTTDAITTESVLAESLATARRISIDAIPAIANRPDAQGEADRQNMNNQAVIGAKEGVIEATIAHVGSDITDTILRAADSSNDLKNIDHISIYELFQVAIAATDRPATKTVLDKVIEVIAFRFDFRKKMSVSLEQLRVKAAKLEAYGITIDEPQLALCILSNVKEAIKHDYGREFRQATHVIRKDYKYNQAHDAHSIILIL